MESILVFNRGEIALRALKAAKELKLKTHFLGQEGDFLDALKPYIDNLEISPKVNLYTDLAGLEEYLSKNNGIKYLYPGYGYLSEDYRLAQLCSQFDVTFIGPTVECLKELSNKEKACELFKSWGVKTLTLTEDNLTQEDFPILLKAAMGGGGRGNQIVEDQDSLEEKRSHLKNKALQLFQSDKLLMERFLTNARHVELQVVATEKKVSIIGSRDCSLQRNYQKVMEEGPVDHVIQTKLSSIIPMIEKGLKELGYKGMGTVEFLWDQNKQECYFLEMNTRIQVEHTVTEMTRLSSTRDQLDLVKDQIQIFTENLSKDYSPTESLHAINARIYAIDPDKEFKPSLGVVHFLRRPTQTRFDSAISQGDEVLGSFDPMIGKLVVNGQNRKEAISNTIRALRELSLHGVKTNIPYLLEILENKSFVNDQHNTSWLESAFEHSPCSTDLGRENDEVERYFQNNTNEYFIETPESMSSLSPDGIIWRENKENKTYVLKSLYRSIERKVSIKQKKDHIYSPVSGVIREFRKDATATIEKGDIVLVVESMKMYFEIEAPKAGTLEGFTLKIGDAVTKDDLLIRILE